jgi:hypothetical protein
MTTSEPEPLSPFPRQTDPICTPQRRAAMMPQANQAAWCVHALLGFTTISDQLAGKEMRRLR